MPACKTMVTAAAMAAAVALAAAAQPAGTSPDRGLSQQQSYVGATTDPRGAGNALFCAAAAAGEDIVAGTCWNANRATRASTQAAGRGPAILMQRSAAAEAFKAATAAAANKVSLVPSLDAIWQQRPRVVGPLPNGSMWDVKCDAVLGCYDTRLESPPILSDVAAGVPAGLTVILWVQGHALHGGDTYVTLRSGSFLDPLSAHPRVVAVVDPQSAHLRLTMVAEVDGRPYNVTLPTAGCGPATLFDNKPHQIAFMLDGATRLATLLVDDVLCGPLFGWAGWRAGASAKNLTHFWASYNMRGLSRLLVFPRTLLTSEVLGSFYAGPAWK
eukprot:SAG31_NODE_4705_length_3021_cov_1.907598_3_plen_328_part_00